MAGAVTERKDWRIAAMNYLARLGNAEYAAFLDRGGMRGKYSPSEYHRDLVEILSRDDEHEFKSLKMQRGCDSVLGV